MLSLEEFLKLTKGSGEIGLVIVGQDKSEFAQQILAQQGYLETSSPRLGLAFLEQRKCCALKYESGGLMSELGITLKQLKNLGSVVQLFSQTDGVKFYYPDLDSTGIVVIVNERDLIQFSFEIGLANFGMIWRNSLNSQETFNEGIL